jgi:hypothetical protein
VIFVNLLQEPSNQRRPPRSVAKVVQPSSFFRKP